MNRRAATIDAIWLVLFAFASTVWCWTAAHELGPTFDEPTNIRCGLAHWHTGSCKELMRLGNMPLPDDVQTLPVYLAERWRGAPLSFAEGLRWARTTTLIFWLALLIYTLRAGKMIGGNWGGRIAVALLASEPIVVGHASLATADIAVSALLLALAVEFKLGRDARWPRRVILPAALYGFAILTKASALVLGPLCLLTIEIERAWRAGVFREAHAVIWNRLRQPFVDLVKIGIGGLIVTFIYCGSDWSTEPTFIEWAQTLPAGKVHDLTRWLAEHLKIFSNAGEGLVQQIKHNIRGNGAFILGQAYPRAIWFYFPVSLTIKLTLGLLALPVVIATLRRGALSNWAFLCALVLLIDSLTWRVQIGVRFMLPLIAFGCAGLGAAAANAWHELRDWKRIALVVSLAAGISFSALATVRVWPNGICFTNAMFGGTANGYRLLSDSNYDWGQGLPELRRWQAQNPDVDLYVWYFGSDPTINRPPFHRLRPEQLPEDEIAGAFRGKIVAVGTTLVYGAYKQPPPSVQKASDLLRANRPGDRTTTFLIYDFRQPAPDLSPGQN